MTWLEQSHAKQQQQPAAGGHAYELGAPQAGGIQADAIVCDVDGALDTSNRFVLSLSQRTSISATIIKLQREASTAGNAELAQESERWSTEQQSRWAQASQASQNPQAFRILQKTKKIATCYL